MKTARMILTLAVVATVAGSALADWDEGQPDKMHFPQVPDLTPEGMDVLAGPYASQSGAEVYEKFLADDWVCSQSGPVTDIHIWASYNEDVPLMTQPVFSLVIYDNIRPADSPTGYSIPGQPLWNYYGSATAERIYATAPEQFYDPNQGQIIGSDTQVWQYNFLFDQAVDGVFQQVEGEVYWLGVKHTYDLTGDGTVDDNDFLTLLLNSPAAFGWKTADLNKYPAPYTGQHFMDDAVWIDVDTWLTGGHIIPYPSNPFLWNELTSPFTDQSLDLAFVITPEPATMCVLGVGAFSFVVRRKRR